MTEMSLSLSDGGLRLLDGTQLISDDFTLPSETDIIDGSQVLEIADSKITDYLNGLNLPLYLKSSALQRLDSELSSLCNQPRLDRVSGEKLLKGYVTAIADELKDEPLVVSVLDGTTIRLFLEDEDDFAMLAENLFTDLDSEDDGKISKSEIKSALVQMEIEMGVPPLSDFPLINDIMKKNGAEGEEKLGQAQFAQLLQSVLQDLADALALKPVTVVQNVKITNGSKLRKLIANENQLTEVIEKIYENKDTNQKMQGCTKTIRSYLEKNGEELGLPPLEANEAVMLLYDSIFSDINKETRDTELEKKEFGALLKKILEKFVEQLQANPVFHDALD